MIYLVQDNLMYDNRPFGIVDSQEQPQFNPVELPVEEVFINSEKKVVLHCWIACQREIAINQTPSQFIGGKCINNFIPRIWQ